MMISTNVASLLSYSSLAKTRDPDRLKRSIAQLSSEPSVKTARSNRSSSESLRKDADAAKVARPAAHDSFVLSRIVPTDIEA